MAAPIAIAGLPPALVDRSIAGSIAGPLALAEPQALVDLGVAFAVGLVIGLQRERIYAVQGRPGPAGARTFPIVALLGGVTMLAGEIAGPLRDVAYQYNMQEFWNSCSTICDRRDYALGGAFNDGKGQPGQISAVSHGSATARFNKVNVINTARRI